MTTYNLDLLAHVASMQPPVTIQSETETNSHQLPSPLRISPTFTTRNPCGCGVIKFYLNTHKLRSIISIGGSGNLCLGRALCTSLSQNTNTFPTMRNGDTRSKYHTSPQKRSALDLYKDLGISPTSSPSLEHINRFEAKFPKHKVVVIDATTNDIIHNHQYIYYSKTILYWTPMSPFSGNGHFDLITNISKFQHVIHRTY